MNNGLRSFRLFPAILLFALAGHAVPAQPSGSQSTKKSERWKALEQSISFTEQQLKKSADDLLWFQMLGETAVVDRIRYAGPPSRIPDNPNPQGHENEVIICAYTFIPK